MTDKENTVQERLTEIERKLESLADDVEEAVGAAITTQEVIVRLERLIEYEILRPLHKPVSLDEVRDKLDELLKRIG